MVEDGKYADASCNDKYTFVCHIHPKAYTPEDMMPYDAQAAGTGTNTIYVEWTISFYNCEIFGYKVKYKASGRIGDTEVVDVPGSESDNVTLTGLEASTWYDIYVTAYTQIMDLDDVGPAKARTHESPKPFLPIPTPDKPCGGTFTAKNDSFLRILSSNYPDNYHNHEYCEWFVNATSNDKVITVYIRDFRTENLYDVLEIGEGSDSSRSDTLVHELSGSGYPWHHWTSSGPSIWLRFTSDYILVRRGFLLEIKETTPSIPDPRPEPEVPPPIAICGENITVHEDAVHIYSPNYPLDYDNDQRCVWKVATDPDARLLVTFVDFETEAVHDWLELGDGLDESDLTTSRLRVTGTDYPLDHESIGEYIWITFTSDNTITEKGFHLTVESITEDLECGEDLVIADETGASVEIYSPNYQEGQDYNNEDLCKWTIATESSENVLVVINDFQTEDFYDWFQVGSGSDPIDTSSRLFRLSGSDVEGSFSTYSDTIWVTWISDHSVTDKGFQVSFVVDEACGGAVSGNPGNLSSPRYPDKYSHGSDCMWTITVPGASRIKISFHDFDLESGYDFLYIGNGTQETSGSHAFEFTGTGIPKDVILNGDEAWVHFTSDYSISGDGFYFTYEGFAEELLPAKPCGETDMELKTGSRLYIQSPNYPADYHINSWCVWKVTAESGRPMTINFRDFATEKGYDWVDIGGGSDETDLTTRELRLSGMDYIPPVVTDSSSLWITFSSDDTVNFRGFLLYIDERDTETSEPKPDPTATSLPPQPCGQHVIVPASGIVNITSPNYPSDYDNNLNCEWTVNSTTGRRIKVTFLDFETEKRKDYLEIGDGNDVSDKSSRLRVISGDEIPNAFISHRSQIWLRFVTDESETRRGFHIEFEEDTSCEGQFSIPESPFNYQLFHLAYQNNEFCNWQLNTVSGGNIRVTVTYFQTEPFFDWMDIGTGTDSTHLPSRVVHWSGTMQVLPYQFITDSNEVWTTFRSDEDITAGGFILTYYDDACVPEEHTDKAGSIVSPRHPQIVGYPHNADCIWTIRYLPGYHIHITIDSFQLENRYDKVLIGIGTDPDSEPYTELTGTKQRGETEIVPSHEVWLRFKSDWTITDEGFTIDYVAECPSGYVIGHENKCYKFVSDPLPWEDARDDCRTMTDSDLVIIDDVDELDYVESQVGAGTNYWIGYSDRAVEGDWRWIDCSHPTEWHLSLWASGQPSNGSGEDCGRSLNKLFYDDLCTTTYEYVCEINPHKNLTEEDQNVQSVDAEPRSTSEIDVWWQVADEHCDVLGYKVKYHRTDYRGGVWVIDIEGADRNSVRLTQLESATWYMMYVAAYTHRNQLEYVPGYPVQTYQVARPPYPIPEPMKCGGEYSVKNDSFLRIISPNYPDRYDNLERCEWFVSASPGKVIAVHIRDFSTEPWFDFLDIGEGSDNSDSSSRMHRLSGIFKPWEYWNSQTNELWLTFITDGFIRLRGFMIELEEIDEELPEPKPLPTEPIEDEDCGTNLTLPTGGQEEIKSPNYPEDYDNNQNCVWYVVSESGARINVTFVAFETELYYDRLTLGNGEDHGDLTTSDLTLSGGSSSQEWYESHGDRMWLTFTSDYTVTMTGFHLILTEIDDSDKTCGGSFTITSDSGVSIESPNYPDNYDADDFCLWRMDVDSSLAGKHILIVIDDFETEFGYDWLEVGTGQDHLETSSSLYRWSGMAVDGSYGTASDELWVQWTSDSSVNMKGFDVRFVPVDPCGGDHTGPTGNITSSGFPMNYPHGSQCQWTITVEEGYTILISLVVFETEENYDYLHIGEGSVVDWSQHYELTGSDLPKDITLNNHEAWLVFTSDNSISRQGFHLTYQQYGEVMPDPKSCGTWQTVKRDQTVIIESPNYPENYPDNVHCEWNVTTESGLPMLVQYRDFATEQGFDWLDLGNGLDSSDVDTRVQHLSGELWVMPLPVISTGENIWLRFTSDDTITKRGFRVVISEYNETEVLPPKTTPAVPTTQPTPVTLPTEEPCGGHIDVPSDGTEYLLSPNYPQDYEDNLNCVWTVSAEQGKRLSVTYLDFETEPWRDILSVGSGQDPSSGLIRTDSGITSAPSPFITATNEIWFQFTTDSSVTMRGFNISLKVPEVCGSQVKIPDGGVERVDHPEGDGEYEMNELCEWFIEADSGRNVRVHILSVDTENNIDVIEIGEGTDSTDRTTRLLQISGSHTDEEFLTHSSVVWMTFRSDSSIQGQGFEIDFYDDACMSENITSFPGDLLSPNHPEDYPHNSHCVWHLTQLEGRQIRLTFNSFRLESGYDFLYVGEGTDPYSTPILTLTGSDLPEIYISGGNTVWLRFESDWTTAYPGFNITYDAECPVGYESGPDYKCYRFVRDDPLPWEEAREICMETVNSDLVIIETEEEYEYLHENMNRTEYWIGLSDRAIEGDFRWVDCSGLQEWQSELQDGSNTPDKDCSLVYDVTTWSTRQCQDSQPYICELTPKNFTLEDQNVKSVDAEALSACSIHVTWQVATLKCDILGY
ncbi:cubilin-like [Ptychodera flava]|uniref:cubilin-like n=1 Tax=Ptychodera flava TaxID=63121 RepID=UPI00396A1EB9